MIGSHGGHYSREGHAVSLGEFAVNQGARHGDARAGPVSRRPSDAGFHAWAAGPRRSDRPRLCAAM
ncbi:hypothetical protein C7S16_4100 [Burkholderia thailandensis]|uniref:Uncharacterized protein n=1 Tax=Burkholderia thailandensis TaxID=57975 RepID=A0AAW9CU11_BURTH|nr:hypothetical protein [Burkholderia thailandensis]MDW9254120.1 hypothetical protein [Burkholderia thailandensis]